MYFFNKSIKQTYIIVAFILNAKPKHIYSAVKIKVPLSTLGPTEYLFFQMVNRLIQIV